MNLYYLKISLSVYLILSILSLFKQKYYAILLIMCDYLVNIKFYKVNNLDFNVTNISLIKYEIKLFYACFYTQLKLLIVHLWDILNE